MAGQNKKLRHWNSTQSYIGGSIFGRFFSNFIDICRPEETDDVWRFSIKQWSNYSTICPARPILRTFVKYLVAFCNRPEGARYAISGVLIDYVGMYFHVAVGDSRSNGSRDISTVHVRVKRTNMTKPIPIVQRLIRIQIISDLQLHGYLSDALVSRSLH